MLADGRDYVAAVPAIGSHVVIALEPGAGVVRPSATARWSAVRGGGGLVSGLAPLVAGTGAVWIAAAMSDGDREAAAEGVVDAEGFRVRLLALDADTYRMAYDVVCNATLWFAHHGLFDLARRPRLDRRWREAWDAYRARQRRRSPTRSPRPRRRTATRARAGLPPGARRADCWPRRARPAGRALQPHAVLRPRRLAGAARRRPPTSCSRAWPATTRAASTPRRWADAFAACCRERASGRRPDDVGGAARPPTRPTSPRSRTVAVRRTPRCASSTRWSATGRCSCGSTASSCRRTCCAGFHAYDDLLDEHTPSGASGSCSSRSCYPSREGLPEYLAYRQEVEGLVARLNDEVGDAGLDADRARGLRRLPPVGRRPAPLRRAAREPDPRRPQPRGQGGLAGQRARRGASC